MYNNLKLPSCELSGKFHIVLVVLANELQEEQETKYSMYYVQLYRLNVQL